MDLNRYLSYENCEKRDINIRMTFLPNSPHLEFVEVQKTMGAAIACDLWPDMPHNFHAYDSLKQSSTEALAKLADVVERRRLPGDTGD